MPVFTPSNEFIEMIKHLGRGSAFQYYHILPSRESYWFDSGNPLSISVSWANHLYFSVHGCTKIPSENAKGQPAEPKYVRGQRKYIAAINCLIGELDSKDFGGDIQNVIAHIKSLPFKPSIQVLSGGGVHMYHLLKDPYIIKNAANRKYISRVHHDWSTFVKGDASKDITRVLRVPGFLNPKYTPAQLVMFLEYRMDRLYELDELASVLPPPFDPPSSRTPANDVYGWRSNSTNPIDEYNAQVRVGDLLERYGYKQYGGGKMLSPYSSTGSAGITIDEHQNKAFCHHNSDPLGDGYWKKSFDILKVLEFGGNFRMAADAIRGSI